MTEEPRRRGRPRKPKHLRRVRPEFYMLPKTAEIIEVAAKVRGQKAGEYLDDLASLIVISPEKPAN